jgi:hypothetical protein
METTTSISTPPVARPSWREQEAPYTYTCKWKDASGLEQFLCIREDHMDSLLAQVKVLTGLIRKSQEHHAAADRTEAKGLRTEADRTPPSPSPSVLSTQPSALPAAGWCALHQVAMERKSNGKGQWYSHALPGGGWCKGKQ